jgi:hypothetical protein
MFLKNFDFISPEITLFHLEKERHSSLFSGIVSLLLIIFGAALAVIFSLDLIERKNPVAYYSKTWEKDIGSFPLDENHFFHFLTIFTQSFPYINEYNSSIINFFGFMNYNKSVFLNGEIDDFNHWIYQICTEEELERIKEYKDFSDYGFTRLCIKYYYNNDTKKYYHYTNKEFIWPNVNHGIENENFTTYTIVMAKCFNNEEINMTNCYDGNVKFQGSQSFAINLTYYEAIVELSNYKEPIKHRLRTVQYSLTKSFIFTANLTMTPIKISSNDGIIFDSETLFKGQKYRSKSMGYSYETNLNLYGGISILLENDEEIYFRNYKKLQDIAGGVDGFTEILVLLFKFINMFIYHDFQVVFDFNKIIEGRITKYYKKLTFKASESIENNLKTNINNPNKNNVRNEGQMLKNIPSIVVNNYINESNMQKNNESFLQLKTQGTVYDKLSQRFKNIKWSDFFIHRNFCGKNLSYIDLIIQKRNKLLSEEKIFKMDITLKYLCEKIENEKNEATPFSNLKKIKSLIN